MLLWSKGLKAFYDTPHFKLILVIIANVLLCTSTLKIEFYIEVIEKMATNQFFVKNGGHFFFYQFLVKVFLYGML